MNSLIGLGVFATFGEPNGFQQIFFFDASFGKSLDLNTNAIEVFPQTRLFSVKREVANDVHSICFSMYSYAKEMKSGRGGTFVGCSVVLRNGYCKAENIYDLLVEVHADTFNNSDNIDNDVIQVKTADELVVIQPSHFESVKDKVSSIKNTSFHSNIVDAGKKLFVLSKMPGNNSRQQVISFFEEAFKHYTTTDTLYFSLDDDIIEYVEMKGLIPVISWDEFFKAGKERPVKKTSKETPDNEGSTFFRRWNAPKGGWNAREVKEKVKEHNRLFEYCEKLKSEHFDDKFNYEIRERVVRKPVEVEKPFRLDKYKIFLAAALATILFLVILLLYKGDSDTDNTVAVPNSGMVLSREQPSLHEEDKQLEPAPNFELGEKDIKILSRSNLKGRTIEDVTEIIFRKNPGDIGKTYMGQEAVYAELIRGLNGECFREEDGGVVCVCDTVRRVPGFKK